MNKESQKYIFPLIWIFVVLPLLGKIYLYIWQNASIVVASFSLLILLVICVYHLYLSFLKDSATSHTSKLRKFVEYFVFGIFILLLIYISIGGILLKIFVEQRNTNYTIPISIVSDIPGGIDLASYITTELKRGVSKEDVRRALISAGWQSVHVDKALNAVIKQPAQK